MIGFSFTEGRDSVRVRKGADETVNNSTTLQDDDELLFPVGANETWLFLMLVYYNSGTTPDIKFAMSVPAGATMFWTASGYDASATITNSAGPTAHLIYGAGANYMVLMMGHVRTGATAGNATLQWAQNTADASDTKVLADSCLMAWRMSG